MKKLSYPLIILGLFWTIFVIWNRIFRHRAEKSLTFLCENYTFFLAILFTFSLGIFLWKMKTFFFPGKYLFSFPYLEYFRDLLDSPSQAYEFFRRKTPVQWGAWWLNFWLPWSLCSSSSMKIFLFFFYHLPTLISPFILLLEIGWGGPLKFFYDSLILLLFPLLVRVSLFLGVREKDVLFSFLRESGLRILSQEGNQHKIEFSSPLSEEEGQSLLSKYKFLLCMESFFKDAHTLLSRYRFFSSFMVHFLYSLSWGSLLFRLASLHPSSLDCPLIFML